MKILMYEPQIIEPEAIDQDKKFSRGRIVLDGLSVLEFEVFRDEILMTREMLEREKKKLGEKVGRK